MVLPITKSARRFGYIIWNRSKKPEVEKMLDGLTTVKVYLNGFYLGEKKIDRKYYRISLGYKFTRALPEDAKFYVLKLEDKNKLKVECE